MIGYSLPKVLLIFGSLAPAISLGILIVFYRTLVNEADLGPISLLDAIEAVYLLSAFPALMCGFALWAFGAFEGRSFWWKISIGALITGAFHSAIWAMQFGSDLHAVLFIAAIAGSPHIIAIIACGFMARRFARRQVNAVPS